MILGDVVATVLDYNIVVSSNTIRDIMFTFGKMPIGKIMDP